MLIIFKWEEADTFLMKQRYERVGERYGNDTYKLGGLFNNDKYEINIIKLWRLFDKWPIVPSLHGATYSH